MNFFKSKNWRWWFTVASLIILAVPSIGHFNKGIDIAGWVQLDYRVDFSKYREAYINEVEYQNMIATAKVVIESNIRKRINGLGLGDAEVRSQKIWSDDYITVKIWWVTDLDAAKEVIGKTVELDFMLPNPTAGTGDIAERRQIAQDLLQKFVSDSTMMEAETSTMWSNDIYYTKINSSTKETIFQWLADHIDVINSMTTGTVHSSLIEGILQPAGTSTNPDGTVNNDAIVWFFIVKLNDKREITNTVLSTGADLSWSTQNYLYDLEVVFVRDRNSWVTAKSSDGKILNGANFKLATVTRDNLGQPSVQIDFDEQGKNIFCSITEQNIGQQMAIFVWWVLVTNPVINTRICGGSAIINGSYTLETAKQLADDLNEWALPAKLILTNESHVDPLLGANAWKWSLWAGLVWLILIFGLMRWRYGVKRAIISLISVLIFLAVSMAILKFFWYALSLSGIAAILLNIGMGVDASILIFERLREEQDRWRSFRDAVTEAYHRSWPAIRDGQMSTLAIWLLLFLMWSDIFQWFGFTMVLNIIVILVVAVPLVKDMLYRFGDDNK